MAAAHEASASPRPRVLNVKPSNGSREYLPSPAISRALQVLGWHEVLAPREPPPAGADETSSSATISPPMRPHKSLPKFDIAWVHSCHASFWRSLRQHQRVNQFPGFDEVATKRALGRTMNQAARLAPDAFDFHPQTFVLPSDAFQLRQEMEADSSAVFIAKPNSSCQGKGIFLVRRPQDVPINASLTVQRYVSRPFLLPGDPRPRKFDWRIYVLVTSCEPLRCYLFEDGLSRFCSEPFEPDAASLSAHLTNYAVNKGHQDFQGKQTISGILPQMGPQERSVALWAAVGALVVRTLLLCQPALSHHYRASFPGERTGRRCFQFLGFDVLVDAQWKPWLIEVNRNPSLNLDSPIDFRVKLRAILGALRAAAQKTAEEEIFEARQSGWQQLAIDESLRERMGKLNLRRLCAPSGAVRSARTAGAGKFARGSAETGSESESRAAESLEQKQDEKSP